MTQTPIQCSENHFPPPLKPILREFAQIGQNVYFFTKNRQTAIIFKESSLN